MRYALTKRYNSNLFSITKIVATRDLKLSGGYQKTTETQPMDCDECDVDQKLIICLYLVAIWLFIGIVVLDN